MSVGAKRANSQLSNSPFSACRCSSIREVRRALRSRSQGLQVTGPTSTYSEGLVTMQETLKTHWGVLLRAKRLSGPLLWCIYPWWQICQEKSANHCCASDSSNGACLPMLVNLLVLSASVKEELGVRYPGNFFAGLWRSCTGPPLLTYLASSSKHDDATVLAKSAKCLALLYIHKANPSTC